MNLYQHILEAATPFFENQAKADQFFTRQCQAHLNRAPKDLTPADLWNLAHWTMISGGLAIGKEKSEALCDKIRSLRRAMN